MKRMNKFTKILLLIAMIFSDLMTPIKVLAEESTRLVPDKGDVGINETVSNNDSVTVSAGAVRNEDGSLSNEGDISVIKTVSPSKDKDGNVIEGRYTIEFNIKGKDIEDTEEVTIPVYVVVVFDRSGSMEDYERVCSRYDTTYWGERYCADWDNVEVKFSAAVAGAKTFASTLLENIPTANIALVTFSSDATVTRNFTTSEDVVKKDLSNANFGSPDGGTNLHAGLKKANELLSDEEVVPENANKYVVVISDGEPTYYVNSNGQNDSDGSGNSTSRNELVATLSEADAIKTKVVNEVTVEDAEIFTIGYSLPSGSVYNDTYNNSIPEEQKYGDLSAEDILTMVASEDTEEDTEKNITHYINADPDAVANAFTNIASSISRTPAGTNATLTDVIGSKFNIVGQSGNTYTSEVISEITSSGTTISFEVEIDETKVTSAGWYNTNDGFSLTYTDANGREQTISTSEDPQVWWIPPVYEYTVNYYKDSTSGTPIASEKFSATNGTVINSVNQDKYLNNSSLGTVGYECTLVSELPVTITDNSTVINVLYTIKKFNYDINYYYDGVLDEELSSTIEDVTYGTEVNADLLHSVGDREGYSLVTGTSTSGIVIIDEENIAINIYYIKNSYGYNINYHFNNELGFSVNNSALFGSVINASDNYLSDSELEDINKENYFISPVRPSDPSQITIGTNDLNNVINIYYVSTVVTDEDIEKTASTNKITSGSTPITYTVNYTSVVKNVNKDDTVTVILKDTLPLEIDESESTLNGGVYDKTTKTITWTFEKTMTEFVESYNASKTITYTVVYENVGNGDGETLVNNVVGSTTAGGKTTVEIGDSTSVLVEIPGKVIVHHYLDGTTTSVADDEELNGLVGQEYETQPETIFGYTLNSDKLPSNASGTYTEEDIVVIYYYTKNDGSIDNTDVVKTSTNDGKIVDSVDSTFNYTITATGEVRDYVGDVTIEVVDTLPYALTEEAINGLSNECEYNSENKTITCKRVITITKSDYVNGAYNVNEEFDLALSFVGVDSETVTNNAKVTIKLDSNIKDEDTDNEEVIVKDGKVIVHHYIDGTTTSVADDEELNGLVGQEYETQPETIFGYTLNSEKLPSNASGTYTEEDIVVIYYYTKNDGSIDNTDVVKTSTNDGKIVDSVDSTFNYTITATGEVRDYVGDVTIEVVDTLPYALTEEAINGLSNECEYNSENKTIICKRVITITKSDYVNGVYNVNEEFDLVLTFVGVDSETVTNNAKVTIKLDSNIKDEDETEENVTVKKGDVIVTYKVAGTDISLHEDITLSGLAGKEYTTEIKTFYGYSLVEVPLNKDGEYLANQTINVDYVYTKNDGTINNNKLVKNGPSSVGKIDDTFNYSFEYNADITGYTGKVTLKVTDKLPFKAVIVSKDDSCVYDENSLTIVCEKEYTVNSDTTINEVFNVSLKYVDITFDDITTNTTLTNELVAELIYGDNKVTDTTSKDTVVSTGDVIVTYKDTDGNELHDNITLNGLSGEEYVTEEKSFFGYTLVSTPSNAEGEFATNQTINVDYVYSKNDGSVEEVEVIKTSNDTDKVIENVNDVFSYTINVKGEIRDYVGNITVIVVDTVPYNLTEEAINGLDNECIYDSENKTITCTRVISNITEDDYINGIYTIDEEFDLDLTFEEVTEEIVINNAKVTIKLDSNVKNEDNDNEEVIVEKGKVTATYKDNLGNLLHEDVVSVGLVGNSYTTEEKTFFGYTLIEIPENKDGIYTKEDIIVNYVYTKNDGSIEDTTVVKTSTDSDKVIDSIDSVFGYTIAANGTIKDYVGDVTLKVIDKLPYEIDTEKSDIGSCTYDKDSKTITCIKEYTIDEDDYTINNDGEKVYVIDEIFTLELVFIGIDSDTVVNTASVEIILDDSNVNKKDEEEEIVTVAKGNVIVTYKDTEGNKLHEDVTKGPELAGTSYTTEEKTFFGYTLVSTPENKDGKYLDNQTIIVNYVYAKNDGSVEDTTVVKTSTDSDKIIDSIDSVFGYTIAANGEVKDYVGDVTLKVVDKLPYEIDTEKSDIGNCTYDKDSKTITCIKEYTIDEDDYTINNDGEKVYVIDETFTLELVFIGIDNDTVVNTASVEIILDDSNVNKKDEEEEIVTVEKGKVIATYKDTLGNKLHEDVTKGPELAGTSYTTENKEFYGYTLTDVPTNANGVYTKEDIIVEYVYSKNIGSSSEELVKEGTKEIENIVSAFDYTIKYNTTIMDYVGEATLVITDELPYEIDIEKSIYNNEICKYAEGKLVCTYTKNITKEDNGFNVEEVFSLYYLNITDSKVTNKAYAVLTYGSTTKTNDSEYTSEVKTGTVTVNYVTKDGTKLTDSVIFTGMVGESYTTEKKLFDKYNFIKVDGEVEGEYTEDDKEVTYVYDLTPLPPQTGVEMNLFIFIKYLVVAAIVLVSGKTYSFIKNN